MSANAFEPLPAVLPAAQAPSLVAFRGFPSSLEASALRTIVDRAARGYPGAWTATWTASGVELRAKGLQSRILLAGPPGAVRVSLRATLGGQSVPEAARSLAVRCRDEAERFTRAQTGPAEVAPLPAPARLHPVQVRTTGTSPLAAVVESALRESAPAPRAGWRGDEWLVQWIGEGGYVRAKCGGCCFRVYRGEVTEPRVQHEDFGTPPAPQPEAFVIVNAVRAALAAAGRRAA